MSRIQEILLKIKSVVGLHLVKDRQDNLDLVYTLLHEPKVMVVRILFLVYLTNRVFKHFIEVSVLLQTDCYLLRIELVRVVFRQVLERVAFHFLLI